MKFISMNDVHDINGGKGESCSSSYGWDYKFVDNKIGWVTSCNKYSKCVDKHGKITSQKYYKVSDSYCS